VGEDRLQLVRLEVGEEIGRYEDLPGPHAHGERSDDSLGKDQ
jgi:hypothetical protein